MKQKTKAEMVWTQLFLVLIAVVLVVILLKPIGSVLKQLAPSSSSENSFNYIRDELKALTSQDADLIQSELIFSIQQDYAILGYDSDYAATSEFVANYDGLDFLRGAYRFFTRGDAQPSFPKPLQCREKACICLWKKATLLKTTEVKDCIVFEGDYIISGLPYTHISHSGDSSAERFLKRSLELVGWDLFDYPIQNLGSSRINDNNEFKRNLQSYGYSQDWYDAYGYLYLPGSVDYSDFMRIGGVVDWGIRRVYLEIFTDPFGHKYLLMVPADDLYHEGINLIDQLEILRQEQYLKELKTALPTIIQNLLEEHEYEKAHQLCGRFTKNYPDITIDECTPPSCSEHMEENCRITAKLCSCSYVRSETTYHSLCGQDQYCYRVMGCSATLNQVQENLGCGS